MSETGWFVEDLSEGQSETFEKVVGDAEIQKFADVSGDTNPVHLDEDYAAGTMFKTRIAHGMLSAGFISAVLGARMPGPGSIYLSQSLKFKAPVKIGDRVVARCTITKIDVARRRVTLETNCYVGDIAVIEGEAMLMVPSKEK